MSTSFLILPRNSRHRKNGRPCSHRRWSTWDNHDASLHGNQARGLEPGDRWQASHCPSRSRSRDHAESFTALEARDHWRSHRCLPGQEAAYFAKPSSWGAEPFVRMGALYRCDGCVVCWRCPPGYYAKVPGLRVPARPRIDVCSPRSGLST